MGPGTVLAQASSKPAATRDWLAIINPAAGYHCVPGWLPRLKERLHEALGAKVSITHDLDNIAEILNAANATTDLAVFGGDGTVARVVNQMHLDHQRLLPLPGGTGNGLARDLGLTTIDRAFAAVRMNSYRAIDVLQITFRAGAQKTRHLAVSTSGLGYSAETVFSAKRLPRSFGLFRYTLASILRTLHMPVYTITVQLDDGLPQERQLSNIMVNNTRHAASYLMFQEARLSDGKMNVLLSGNRFWEQTIGNLAIMVKSHTAQFHRDSTSVKSLNLHSSTAMRLMLDGETWDGVDEVSFVVLKDRLQCYSQ